ncbi:MAG: hypothetical protein MHPSP_001846 [Paramarteilia canceri]
MNLLRAKTNDLYKSLAKQLKLSNKIEIPKNVTEIYSVDEGYGFLLKTTKPLAALGSAIAIPGFVYQTLANLERMRVLKEQQFFKYFTSAITDISILSVSIGLIALMLYFYAP